LETLERHADDDRISARALLQLLDEVVTVTGAHDLGLCAATLINDGDYDVLELTAGSCATVGEALNVILRYVGLLYDAADFSFAIHAGRVRFAMRSIIALGRAASDFQTCVFVRALRDLFDGALPANTEIWFRHAAPPDVRNYPEAFAGARVLFSSPVDAILFDANELAREVGAANPKLHRVLRTHADHMLTTLPRAQSLPATVRSLITERLADGNVAADHIAACLQLSRRTLTRRLAASGTTYQALLDEERRRVGIDLLETTELCVRDIALRLGFSEVAAFSRACKRWTGLSPARLRQARTKHAARPHNVFTGRPSSTDS
jgi:AraC-like DNA-binding protein